MTLPPLRPTHISDERHEEPDLHLCVEGPATHPPHQELQVGI